MGSLCHVFAIPCVGVKERKNKADHQVQHPAEVNEEPKVLCGSHFETLPTRAHGADGGGLEDAQEADAAHGHAPAHSMNILSESACEVKEEMFEPESCHHMGNSGRKKQQAVGHHQVPENQVGRPELVFGVIKERLVVKDREIAQDPDSVLC